MGTKQQLPNDNVPERFESDTDKIVHRHLADKNHVITDEELQSIRVGQLPLADETGDDERNSREEKIADRKSEVEDEVAPGTEKLTPWDVVE